VLLTELLCLNFEKFKNATGVRAFTVNVEVLVQDALESVFLDYIRVDEIRLFKCSFNGAVDLKRGS
jgi:hypothetical protein